VGQYIKDIVVREPECPSNLTARPQIELSVDLQARQLERRTFRSRAEAAGIRQGRGQNRHSLLELVYAGLFHLQNIPDRFASKSCLIEAPHILFPFARRIVADIVRDGGMPPLMIEPIDFAALYRAKAMEMQQMRAGDTGHLDA